MHVLLCLLRSPSLLNVDKLPSRGPLSLGIAALLPALPLGLVALACNRPVRQPSSTPPDLQRIVFAPVAGTSFQEFEGRSGNQRFILAGPDEPRRPTAWLGPLQIQDLQTGTSCQSNVSLVTAVYAGAGGDVSVVISHSGSLTYTHLLDPRSCKQKHPPIEAFTEGVQIAGRRIRVLPGCECPGRGAPCDCSAGQVFELDQESEPVLQARESLSLTKQVLGVAFQGRKRVANPKTPNARVVED